MQVAELIEQFRDAAIAKGDGVGGAEDARLYRLMSTAFRQLVMKGDRGNLAFEKLLFDECPYVRVWVAAQLLFLGHADANGALEELSASGGRIGFSASVTLEEYKNGRLGSPL